MSNLLSSTFNVCTIIPKYFNLGTLQMPQPAFRTLLIDSLDRSDGSMISNLRSGNVWSGSQLSFIISLMSVSMSETHF